MPSPYYPFMSLASSALKKKKKKKKLPDRRLTGVSTHLYLSSAHHFWLNWHVVTENASYTLSCILSRVSPDSFPVVSLEKGEKREDPSRFSPFSRETTGDESGVSRDTAFQKEYWHDLNKGSQGKMYNLLSS